MLSSGLRSSLSGQGSKVPILVIVLGLIFGVTLLFSGSREDNLVTTKYRRHDLLPNIQGSAALCNPTVALTKGTRVIWEIPTDPKAVLFIAHGCSGTPLNFWETCPSCPECVGLPEERQVVLDALDRKYAVLVVASAGDCWSYGKERSKVKKIIRRWLEKNNLVNVPLVGLGASSGGYFLSIFATDVKFKAIVLMIASGLYDKMDDILADYPPTLFVHMPKDVNRTRKVNTHMEKLKKKGIEVKEIKCMDFPLAPNYLAERIAGIENTTSSKLFKLFRDEGFIDAKNYMKMDGRDTPWKEAVKKNNVALPFGSRLMHHIQEELNLAYAFHEMTSLQSDDFFEWLDFHLK